VIALGLLAAACGGDPASATPAQDGDASGEAWPADGFLHYLPDGTMLVARLPTLEAVRAEPRPYRELVKRFGWGEDVTAMLFGAAEPDGLDADRSPGFVRTVGDAWAHYLPATDKGRLNAALAERRSRLTHREEGDWIILSKGGAGAGRNQGDPLPPGTMALRVHHHPLLTAFANPGDTVEAGGRAGPGGLEFRGRLRTGARSPTADVFAAAGPMPDERLDLLPPTLAPRVETTLPAAELASMLAARLAVHGGIRAGDDRVVVERFLREVFTGADSAAGYAFGVDFRDGSGTLVATGRLAGGRDSPILHLVRGEARSTYGPLVLDLARGAPEDPAAKRGRWRWRAWLVEPDGKLEGLPDSLWESVGLLVRGEEAGLEVVYERLDDRFVFAAGPRADRLAAKVAEGLRGPFRRSLAGTHLRTLYQAGDGDYKLGIAVDGRGVRRMPDKDLAALRRAFFAGEDGSVPSRAVLALWQEDDGGLGLLARLLY